VQNQVNILVLVSGNGTNLQALIDAEKKGALGPGTIVAVISDRPGAYALERARAAGIPVYMEPRGQTLSDRILHIAKKEQAGLIILAGFLSILKGELIKMYTGRMINLHPSLLPRFGGKGMKGEQVHQAVLEAGEPESGCTVHLVDEGIDTGSILLQRRVPVLPGDTVQSLADRIHHEEHIAIVGAAALMSQTLFSKIA
jgi:phosphoribosylglycinamide formyltransferase-1